MAKKHNNRPPSSTFLNKFGPLMSHEGPCPYFPQKSSCLAFFMTETISKKDISMAMNMGMRRSGLALYRPLCIGCRRCLATRIRVDQFSKSKSQIKLLKTGQEHFSLSLSKPIFDEERYRLFIHYLTSRHPHQKDPYPNKSEFKHFLIDSCADTRELSFRDKDGKLAAISIVDITKDSLSSIYFYWHQDFNNFSMGTISILHEIELTKSLGKKYYHLGYYVRGYPQMEYKNSFQGLEIFSGEKWEAFPKDKSEALQKQFLRRLEQSMTACDSRNFCDPE